MDRKTLGRFVVAVLLGCALAAVGPTTVGAQQAPAGLTVGLLRTFGYGGFNEIQGNFRFSAKGPVDLVRVVFYLDAQVMGEDTKAPFQLDFVTDTYPAGVRSLRAVGYTASGQVMTSNVITTRFLSASQAQGQTVKLVVGLLGTILGLMGLSALVTGYLTRGRRHVAAAVRPANGIAGPVRRPADYGWMGGVVCPRCGKPSPCLWYAPNLVMGKLQRCPHCGRWAIVGRASANELARAESLLAAEPQPVEGTALARSSEDQLQADLERSRYEDSRN